MFKKPLKARLLIFLPIVAIICLSLMILVINVNHVSREVVGTVTERLQGELEQHVQVRVSNLLEQNILMNRAFASAVHRVYRSDADLDVLRPIMWRHLLNFDRLDALYFGTASGTLMGYARFGEDYVYFISSEDTEFRIDFYATDPKGQPQALVKSKENFPLFERTWFIEGQKTSDGQWGQPFRYFAYPEEVAIPYSKSVENADGQFLGVVGSNFFVTPLSQFLNNLELPAKSRSFILNRHQSFIASSSIEEAEQHKLLGTNRAIFDTVQPKLDKVYENRKVVTTKTTHSGIDYHVMASPIKVFEQDIWSLVVAIDNEYFAGPSIWLATKIILIFAAIIFLVMIVVSLILRTLASPLERLTTELNKVDTTQPQDFRNLAQELKRYIQSSNIFRVFELEQLKQSIMVISGKLASTLEKLRLERERREEDLVLIKELALVAKQTDNMVVITDVEGKIEWVNDAFTKITHYELDEIIGKSPGSFLQGPLTSETIKNKMKRAIEKGESVSTQVINYSKDGEPYWNQISIEPILSDTGRILKFFSIQQNVTDYVQFTQRLKRWKEIFDSADWGIVVSQGWNGHLIEMVNPKICNLLGRTEKELMTRSLCEFVSEAEFKKLEKLFANKVDGQTMTFESELVSTDGTVTPILVNISYMKTGESDQSIYQIAHIQDITTRRLSENKLREAIKMESLGRLVGGIAHDFNNALGIMIGYVDILKMKLKDDDFIIERLDRIAKAADRGKELTQKLLRFSKFDPVAAQTINLNKSLRELEPLIKTSLKSKCDLALKVPEEDLFVRIDKGDLDDALINLAINAEHALSDSGKFEISLKKRKLLNREIKETELDPDAEYAVIKCKDDGDGIDPKVIDKVFDPFFSTKGPKGSGLGLSQVYGFVKRSQGEIFVKSSPGKETIFTIVLPLVEAEIELKPKIEQALTINTKDKIRTLVVDDEVQLGELVGSMLDANYFDVAVVDDVKVAIEYAEKNTYDLLVTDILMPGIDGVRLSKTIKTIQPNIKVIYISGYAEDLDSEVRNQTLLKPFHKAELLKYVHKLFDT